MNPLRSTFDRTDGHYIVTDFNTGWTAVLRGYDGAPDAKGPNSQIGLGSTELAAVADLLDKIDRQ